MLTARRPYVSGAATVMVKDAGWRRTWSQAELWEEGWHAKLAGEYL